MNLAFEVLNMMHDRTWMLSKPSVLDKSTVGLESLRCDIDSGIFYLKSKKKTSGKSVKDIVSCVTTMLTREMKKTQVLYVTGVILHSIAKTDKPTLETVQGGDFVKISFNINSFRTIL